MTPPLIHRCLPSVTKTHPRKGNSNGKNFWGEILNETNKPTPVSAKNMGTPAGVVPMHVWAWMASSPVPFPAAELFPHSGPQTFLPDSHVALTRWETRCSHIILTDGVFAELWIEPGALLRAGKLLYYWASFPGPVPSCTRWHWCLEILVSIGIINTGDEIWTRADHKAHIWKHYSGEITTRTYSIHRMWGGWVSIGSMQDPCSLKIPVTCKHYHEKRG